MFLNKKKSTYLSLNKINWFKKKFLKTILAHLCACFECLEYFWVIGIFFKYLVKADQIPYQINYYIVLFYYRKIVCCYIFWNNFLTEKKLIQIMKQRHSELIVLWSLKLLKYYTKTKYKVNTQKYII